jgi:hypothetical protein
VRSELFPLSELDEQAIQSNILSALHILADSCPPSPSTSL